MSKIKLAIVSIFLLVISMVHVDAQAKSKEYRIRVFNVLDEGVFITTDGKRLTFMGVNIPSVYTDIMSLQMPASMAKRFLLKTIYGKWVTIKATCSTKRTNDAIPALVYLDDSRCVNRELIARGFGSINNTELKWNKKALCDNGFSLLKLEENAKQQHMGVWSTSLRIWQPDPNQKFEPTSPSNPKRKLIS